MITVRLHRWQPRSQRFRTQNFSLDDPATATARDGDYSTFFGLILQRGLASVKPSASHVTARTHRVDVIEFDACTGVLEIWMSPIVDRTYKRELNTPSTQASITTRKKRLDEPTCICHHRMEDHHNSDMVSPASGICLIPGCNCKHAQLKETREEKVRQQARELGLF